MGITDRIMGAVKGGAGDSGTRVRAVWNGAVVAESDETKVVEGNHYFPPHALRRDLLAPSEQTSVCPWKGTASYYDIVVEGERNAGAAWSYAEPREAAAAIRDHVAFWRGVTVEPAG